MTRISDYREGYETGKSVGPLQQVGHAFFHFLYSEEHNQGYKDADSGKAFNPGNCDHQERKPSTGGSSGGGGGIDLPLPLILMLALPVLTLYGLYELCRRPLLLGKTILVFTICLLPTYLLLEAGKERLATGWFEICVWILLVWLGFHIGRKKRRPLLGILLGGVFPVWGHIILAFIPDRKT